MPTSTVRARYIISHLIAACIFFTSCGNRHELVPFPVTEQEYNQPATKPFEFSTPETIQWAQVPADSIKPITQKPLDLNTLKRKSFNIDESYSFLKPMEEKKIDWAAIPDTAFDLAKLPAQKIKYKTYLLGAPKLVRARVPSLKPNTTRGVLEAGLNMNLPGIARCFLEDSDGQFWIGTEKGLCKYDGENIEIYGAAQGLLGESIFSLMEDNRGRIWIGTTLSGLFIMDRKAGLISELTDSFPHAGMTIGLIKDKEGNVWVNRINAGVSIIDPTHETIRSLTIKEGLLGNVTVRTMQDRDGLFWITTQNGVNVLDLKAKTNKRFAADLGIKGPTIYSLLEDDGGRIWMAGIDGINIYDKKSTTIKYLGKEQGLGSFRFISQFMLDRSGKVWAGTDSGTVYAIQEKSGSIERFHVADGAFTIINHMFEDKYGQIWFGAQRNGSAVLNTNGGRPGNITTANGLSNNAIWTVHESASGNIWLGTVDGVDLISPTEKTIRHIGKEQGLHHERTTTLLEDQQGQIWCFGNQFGISIIDQKNKTIKYMGKAQGLPSNEITVLFEEKNGLLWMGTGAGEIFTVDLPNKVIKKIANIPDFATFYMNTFKVDNSGQLWISSLGGGVLVIDAKRETMRRLNMERGLTSNESSCFLKDSKGNIWVGGKKGLDRVDMEKNTLTSFTPREGLAAEDVYTVDELNGRIFVGTSKGLTLLTPSPKGWMATTFGKEQGLGALDFAQNSSLLHSNGQYWAGVEEQVLLVMDEPKLDTLAAPTFVTGISIMDKQQGFSNAPIIEKNIANLDTIWNPATNKYFTNKVLPRDTGYLQKNGITWDSVAGANLLPVNLRLPYNQNYLSFTFTGSHINNPDKRWYRYMLVGIDKNWSPVSSKDFSENYRDLSAGNYIFKVASKGFNGIWSTPAEFAFTITPPWWMTWWAYLSYALAFAGAVAWYIHYRSISLKMANQVLEEKVISRTIELRKSLSDLRETQNQLIQSEKMASLGELTAGIAHEIQNPLNFVNNFSEISVELADEITEELKNVPMEEQKYARLNTAIHDLVQNQQKINFHGKRADAIVKGMLQHSRSTAGKKELTDVNALADEYLRLSYHGLRARDKSFNATMETAFDPALPKLLLNAQDIGRVMLNLITNAFYAVTEKKKLNIPGYVPTVWVQTKKEHGKVEIRIKDNGIGIPTKLLDKIYQPFFTTKPAGQGTGLGLSLSYDIVTKGHGGEMQVETKEGEGSVFIIILRET